MANKLNYLPFPFTESQVKIIGNEIIIFQRPNQSASASASVTGTSTDQTIQVMIGEHEEVQHHFAIYGASTQTVPEHNREVVLADTGILHYDIGVGQWEATEPASTRGSYSCSTQTASESVML